MRRVRGGDGEELGGINDLFIQQSGGSTKEQALYKITWHPEPERNCLKQNAGLDDSWGLVKKTQITRIPLCLQCPQWWIISVL